MKTILRNSVFEAKADGNGGHRRTAQIDELVRLAGFAVKDVKPLPSTRLERYQLGIRFLLRNSFPISSVRTAAVCGHEYLNHKTNFEQHLGKKVILWEKTVTFTTVHAAKEFGFKVIALPHNIESLVPGQSDPYTHKPLPESLENELQHLAKADAIFCISREEQWLLKLRGIDADFLPYYPAKPILEELLKVRELRQDSQKKRFLILGSANNSPTYQGMLQQIEWLSQINDKDEFEVDIAGYCTELLAPHCNHPKFNLIGAVDAQKLHYLMLNAKAVLVHQQAGAGALTRIPEMLIAGIPIIANSNACRSAYDYPGIYCYDNQSELVGLINRTFEDPPLLNRPLDAEQRFIQCLRDFAE